MRKKLLSILALLCLTVSGAWADDNNPSSGCGDPNVNNGMNVTWILTNDGVMTISGSGAMADYEDPDDRPWSDQIANITSVVINEGVTRIGNKAFYDCSSLTTVTIYASPCTLGDGVFTSCGNLTHIYVFSDKVVNYKSYGSIVTAIPNVTVSGVTANQDPENTSNYWCTYYHPAANVKINTADVKIFTVSLSDDELTLNDVTGNGVIKAGQAVVLKATASGDLDMELTSSAPTGDFSGNELRGTTASMKGNGHIYVLNQKNEFGVGFYKLDPDGTIEANKAYLYAEVTGGGEGGSLAREFFLFDEATGIVELKNSRIEELKSDDAWYSLDGRKLDGRSAEGRLQAKKATTKGLYIVGGKKVVIK